VRVGHIPLGAEGTELALDLPARYGYFFGGAVGQTGGLGARAEELVPAMLAWPETKVEFGDTHVVNSNGSGDVEIGSRRCEPAFGQVIGALGRRGGWTRGDVRIR
jgi:hypothetical protein